MNFELHTLDTESPPTCDALLVVLTSTFKPGKDALSTLIAKALKTGDLLAKAGQRLDILRPRGMACTHAVLVHTGDGGIADVRKGVVGALGCIQMAKPSTIAIHFADQPTETVLRVVVTAIADASYVYTTTKPKAERRTIERVLLSVPDSAPLNLGFRRAVAAVLGIELAKEWTNRPANHATPSHLADAARALAEFSRIKCEVLGPKDVAKLGMGAFQAVAQGSAEPLRFIVLRYTGAAKSAQPVVLIGKGITFDSGGICIKPASNIDTMKFDMSGAASVLGVFRALAELQPAVNVVGLIPSCENLPSGQAIKPGDVVTSLSGQTIEILNTDAEGRLILCDALTYAERFKPRVVIDIATLTGACVIALGSVRSALFTANETLSHALQSAGESSQDLCWPMPLDDEYADKLQSRFADVANVAGRPAGSITAAKFLQRFTASYPWAHLDIAGTAWKTGDAKGATGRPVGLLVDYLMALDRPEAPSDAN